MPPKGKARVCSASQHSQRTPLAAPKDKKRRATAQSRGSSAGARAAASNYSGRVAQKDDTMGGPLTEEALEAHSKRCLRAGHCSICECATPEGTKTRMAIIRSASHALPYGLVAWRTVASPLWLMSRLRTRPSEHSSSIAVEYRRRSSRGIFSVGGGGGVHHIHLHREEIYWPVTYRVQGHLR